MTRRDFLASTLAVSAIAPTADRAFVGLFLRGGNDANNMIVPLRDYKIYRALRGPLAIPKNALLPIGDYGFHPRLRFLASRVIQNRAAIAVNVGVMDAARSELYSHTDQQTRWQSLLHDPQTLPLESIPQAIAAGSRGTFLATLDGFDTHGNQLVLHDGLMTKLDRAVESFQARIENLGLGDQVTLFTMSEFSRNLIPNSTAGTDHGWGSHHFILGPSIHGVVGEFPDLASHRDGLLRPTTSIESYFATIFNVA